ncbi:MULTISPECIES: hypothetical protein [unclassified Variovorax]|uniref:hypothetical protein n=1 Tax=unclassified Variovorax TaxID=663243 RepID=UPI003F51505A
MRRLSLYLASMAATAIALAACSGMTGTPQSKMSFFLTSTNPGKGADFGGLAGADRYCQSLAASAGAGGRTWRAYLSNSALAGSPAVNARDRIGSGPWLNAKGELIASNVDGLHGPDNKLNKQTALTEKGETISGSGDAVTLHDILTGSSPDGRAVSDGKDNTCGNWTKGGEGSAIVGHHDRRGLDDSAPAKSWNSSHPTRGCSLDALKSTGGGGLMYCFAQ